MAPVKRRLCLPADATDHVIPKVVLMLTHRPGLGGSWGLSRQADA